MKFAQYLRDTQTPEWKKAYIDYRGLKKRITAIRKAQQGAHYSESPEGTPNAVATPPSTPRLSSDSGPELKRPILRRNTVTTSDSAFSSALQEVQRTHTFGGRSLSFHRPAKSVSSRFGGAVGKPTNPLAALPLQDVLMQLSPLELAFFNHLDAQLEKVELFYLTREKEAEEKGKLLESQIQELMEHRKIFLEANGKVPWAAALTSALKPKRRHLKITRTISVSTEQKSVKTDKRSFRSFFRQEAPPIGRQASSSSEGCTPDKEKDPEMLSGSEEEPPTPPSFAADPDTYLYAKRKLKKAVTEHYRGLELLHNYRILNLTGFRKALKKFEKVTRISVQNQYMAEKVNKSSFASDESVRKMMKSAEDLFAFTFVKGNKKKAMQRLRSGNKTKTHHFSTFRSGLLLGLAIPALVAGLVNAFQEETREEMRGWGALMLIYGTLFVPTLFVALVGLNILVWARSRINYVFIFELKMTTALDYREYFEVPSMLLCGLAYCFWLSFARMGEDLVSPTMWPLVWLGGTALLVLNPFPFVFHHTRFWLIKVVAKLFLTGTRRVEFTDFWIGDQFCSLVFTLQGLFTLGCIYANDFSPDWQHQCGLGSPHWPAALVLAISPFVLRLVQSIKRYADSGLITHLINGGKYGAGILSSLLFFLWRHNGADRSGTLFALWLILNTVYSVYACTWDFLMDWSFLKRDAPNPWLRKELVYTSYVPLYYFAIISNILLRFTWVWHVPSHGPNMLLRSFVIAVLEVLRRWQWNFYRLENEHLGNMDQYRVTREVPLPYLFDDPHRHDADDDDDDDAKHIK